jgi:CO/xanthine dehydrogenase Mo-binding subunit
MNAKKRGPIASAQDMFGNSLFVEDVGEPGMVTVEIVMRSPLATGKIVDLNKEAARRVGEALIKWADQ